MKALRLTCMFALAGLAVVAAVLLSGTASYGQVKGGFPENRASGGGIASTPPKTAMIPDGLVTLRVDFKSKAEGKTRIATDWDGKVTVSGGRIRTVRLWQEDPRNTVTGTQWKLTTLRKIPWNRIERQRGHKAMPLKDGAIVIELLDCCPEAKLNFQTEQGDFHFPLKDIEPGKPSRFLKGMTSVSRMANSAMILSAPTEDDFPSAATGPDGKLYVAYVAFTHGKSFRDRGTIRTRPKDYSYLEDPTGGDQVLLLRLDGGKWTGPLAVTPKGQDVYRTATAVDGKGRAWVFWTAKAGGAWNLFARCLTGNRWSTTLQITNTPTPDIFPVATTDKDGRVWLAWQAFGKTNSGIHASRQEGDAFSRAIVVADAPGNEWTPAIAASKDGQVAVAWDTYAKGDYDVYCSVASDGKFGVPVPIAATTAAEMRPSVAYDTSHRLWIAYESGPALWGKDMGALEQQGQGLYRARSVAIRVLQGGKLSEPAQAPSVPFTPGAASGKKGSAQKLSLPRLAADETGRIWLAVRSPRLGTRVTVGTTWFEHVSCYSGGEWTQETVCPASDGILDNRPALVPQRGGGLTVINAADGRFGTGGKLPSWYIKALQKEGQKVVQKKAPPSRWPDPVNNELMMAQIAAPTGTAPAMKLEPVDLPKPGQPDAWTQRERKDIARAQAATTTVLGKTVQLYRGEFHRHTELSGDGGGDGLLMDMWRYALDVTGFDWIGNGDHDNGNGREYSWWITQKTTDMLTLPGSFVPMFTYERSCSYPDGHRNAVFDRRGIRTLQRLDGGKGKAMDNLPADDKRPNSPDTQVFYEYLRHFSGICASHTSGTDMGTDWRDSDAKVEPIVEIYQGCRQNYEMPGAPRSNTAQDSKGGWRPLGFVSRALKMGIRFGFQSSSDHGSVHISYCNVWVEQPTREAILTAMKRRHIYGSTDNIIAVVHSGKHFMGDEFTTADKPTLQVKLIGTQPFAKVHVIKDGSYVHTAQPKKQTVEFQWTDFAATAGATSYYYIRGEQEDGELVWVSPMWITYKP